MQLIKAITTATVIAANSMIFIVPGQEAKAQLRLQQHNFYPSRSSYRNNDALGFNQWQQNRQYRQRQQQLDRIERNTPWSY